jgi:hypothetical protein
MCESIAGSSVACNRNCNMGSPDSDDTGVGRSVSTLKPFQGGVVDQITFIWERDTKNFGVYVRQDESKPMSREYFPLGLPKKLTYKLVPDA